MSHTAGPWRVVKDAVVTDNQVGSAPADTETLKYYGGEVVCESATPSNARLIATAPNFYEAAKGVLAGFDAKVFVRNTDGDHQPGWAIKAFPYLLALGKLVEAVNEADGPQEQAAASSSQP